MRGGGRIVVATALSAAMLIVPTTAGAERVRPAVAGDWPQTGFDPANTHFNPSETALTTANVGSLVPSWNIAGAAASAPAIANGTLFVQGATLTARNLATGAQQWSAPIAGALYESSVAVADGVVYTVDVDTDTLNAVDAATGHVLWKRKVKDYAGRNITAANSLVSASNFSKVFAIDTATHGVKWTFNAGGTPARATISNGNVYVSSSNGKVYSLDEATGATNWSRKIGSSKAGDKDLSSPTVAGGIVYVGQDQATMFALDASTGAVRWSFKTASKYTSDAAVANGTVYFGDYDTNVYALNATTGKQRWKYKTGNTLICDPVVANGVVYVSSTDKNLFALNATSGTQLWTLYVGISAVDNLVVSNGSIYAGFYTGRLRRFTLPT